MSNGYIILVRKPERNRPLGRRRRRREDNIRTDLGQIAWKVVDLIRLAQDSDQLETLMIKVMKLPVT